MLGFTAEADPAQPVRVDPEEIAEARWFSRRDITQLMGVAAPATALDATALDVATGTDATALDAAPGTDAGTGMGLPMRASIAFYLIERWLGHPGS
jgi:NAD+ diphosphatase